MRVEGDRRPAVAEAAAHEEIGAGDHPVRPNEIVGHLVALDREAEGFEQPGRPRGMGVAVAGRVVGGSPDEFGEEGLHLPPVLIEIGADQA
jgi:hypothetical protein